MSRSGAIVRGLIVVAGVCGLARAARADVIMSAGGLNATLKTMERLSRQSASADPARRNDALFELGAEADRLAALMNQEVEAHGMQERALLDLAISRTHELGIGISYNRGKKKFFYDGTAFERYLASAPRGPHAADAEFVLLSYRFYQSTASDVEALSSAAAAKEKFLSRYPRFRQNAELRLYLAIDYRDLYRLHHQHGDAGGAEKYRRLARSAYQLIIRQFPRTEQAESARQLLKRFDEETRVGPPAHLQPRASLGGVYARLVAWPRNGLLGAGATPIQFVVSPRHDRRRGRQLSLDWPPKTAESYAFEW